MRVAMRWLVGLFLLSWMVLGWALSFQLTDSNVDIVGEIQHAEVQANDDFDTIARRFDIGYYDLIEANPGVDPDHPKPGTVLVVPTQYILPNAPHRGIVINLAELRLYYYPKQSDRVYTFPLGIGRQNWQTPTGHFTVIEKQTHPVWRPPESVRKAYYEETGEKIPKVFPPGNDNPLGDYYMRLSNPMYLIHGTNDPAGIGKRASSGCIRMFPEDIKSLFHMADKGTEVHIVNDPYKATWYQGKLYLEAHMPLQEQQKQYQGSLEPARRVIKRVTVTSNGLDAVNWAKAMRVAGYELGIPMVVGQDKQSPR